LAPVADESALKNKECNNNYYYYYYYGSLLSRKEDYRIYNIVLHGDGT
jgi:hypothetical protein